MSGFHILPDPNKFRLEPGVVDEGPSIFYPKYGDLYNWYAATDVRNIAAEGWHVATIDDEVSLVTASGGYMIAGGNLKEIGFIYWDDPNAGASNDYGFNSRGSGSRNHTTGVFSGINRQAFYWINYDYIGTARHFAISYNTEYIATGAVNYKLGLSVRLVKDSTSLSNGQTGTYTGNDGKVYRTICIGTIEVLADNLCETLYRNGDPIPEVTDGLTWAGLTTGALCVYSNDWSNV